MPETTVNTAPKAPPPTERSIEDWLRVSTANMTPTRRRLFLRVVGLEPKTREEIDELQSVIDSLASDVDENGVKTFDTIEEIDPALVAAARAYHRWPIGKLLSREDFETAIEKIGGLTFGSSRRETIKQGEARRSKEVAAAAEKSATPDVDAAKLPKTSATKSTGAPKAPEKKEGSP